MNGPAAAPRTLPEAEAPPRFVVRAHGVAVYGGPEIGANEAYIKSVDKWGTTFVTIGQEGTLR